MESRLWTIQKRGLARSSLSVIYTKKVTVWRLPAAPLDHVENQPDSPEADPSQSCRTLPFPERQPRLPESGAEEALRSGPLTCFSTEIALLHSWSRQRDC